LDNPNDIEDDRAADDKAAIEQNNDIKDLEYLEQQDMSAVPSVPGMVWPTGKSNRQAEKVLETGNIIERRRNKGVKKQ